MDRSGLARIYVAGFCCHRGPCIKYRHMFSDTIPNAARVMRVLSVFFTWAPVAAEARPGCTHLIWAKLGTFVKTY